MDKNYFVKKEKETLITEKADGMLYKMLSLYTVMIT